MGTARRTALRDVLLTALGAAALAWRLAARRAGRFRERQT